MGLMRIVCISDLHQSEFPEIPDADLLIIAGDLCCGYNQPYDNRPINWLYKAFLPWIEQISKKMKIVGVAGNHDWPFFCRQTEIDEILKNASWTYLQDSYCYLNGLKIWGTPWTPVFHDWAFNLHEEYLKDKFEQIHLDTNILISHGPPYGLCDLNQSNQKCGSTSLRERIKKVKPQLVVCGHIHEGYGHAEIGKTKIINCSLMNANYENKNKPVVVNF